MGQPEHLRQIAQRAFAAVVLPVGVGEKAGRGVEREIRRHRRHVLRIERQCLLQAQQRIKIANPPTWNRSMATV